MKALNINIDDLIDILMDLKKRADYIDAEVDKNHILVLTPIPRIPADQPKAKKLDPKSNLDDLAF